MTSSAMPAFRPTANCIWNSFRSSSKRHILISGGTAGDRLTLLQELSSLLPAGAESCENRHGSANEDTFLIDLDAPYGNTGCIIMASGLGRRFGGNKLMADFSGVPMIQRVLSATEGIFTRRVVVTRHEDVAELCKSMDIEFVLHDLPHRSDTVRLGLKAVGHADNCVFCPADQPLLRRETIAALALAAENEPGYIWRTAYEGEQGMPVCFPSRDFEELCSLPEGKGGGYVIKKYPERLRLLNVRDQYELMDVDRPEDLAELAKR